MADVAPPIRVGLLVLLSVQFGVLGLIQAWTDGMTFDESPALAGGLSALVHRDLRIVPEHPVLPRALAAVPVLPARPQVPRTPAWEDNRWFDYADDLVAAQVEAGDLRRVVFLSRLVPLVAGVGCGLALYVLATRLTDPRGGLLVAGLWFTTPLAVGFSHLNGLDVPFTLAVVLVALGLEKLVRQPSLAGHALLGGALGLALLCRHTGLALVPLAALIGGWRMRHDRRSLVLVLGCVLLLPLAATWVVYRSLDPSGPPAAVAADFQARIGEASRTSVVARAALAVPFPLEYRAGLAYLVLTSDDRPAFLVGQAWEGARPWFFPASAAVKLPATVLVATGLGAWWWRRRPAGEARRLALAVLAPAAGLFLFLALQPLNLGLRYALPVVALLLVLAAPLARGSGRARWVVVAVVAGQVAATIDAHPHSIAWTPPPFRPAHQVVSDSNLDFGQGYWDAAAWIEGREGEEVRAAMALPRGIPPLAPGVDVDDPALAGGAWVVVSATALTLAQRHELSWVRAYCPVRTLAGGSILVYRFDGRPDPSPGPDRPAGLCRDAVRSERAG